MKILFSSYHNPNFESMTESIEKTILNMGFQLETFDWYKFLIPGRLRERLHFLDWIDVQRINHMLINKVKNFRPDILIVAGGFTIYAETIKKLKNLTNVIAVNWIADYPRNFDLQLKSCIYYDHFFVSGSDALGKYRATGRKNGHWLPFACDPEIHKPVNLSSEEKKKYGCDICFVGSNYPERIELLEALGAFDLGIWGIGWEKLPKNSPLRGKVRGGIVRPEEWVKIFSASKIVLNITPRRALIKAPYISEMHENEFRMCNIRLFEILGCGAFQLVDAKPDAITLFKNKKHLVFYNSKAQLIERAQFYLENPAERARIARNGRQAVMENHTYQHRVEKILSVAKNKK